MEKSYTYNNKNNHQKNTKPFFNKAKEDTFFGQKKGEEFFSQNPIQTKTKSNFTPHIHQPTIQTKPEETTVEQEQTNTEENSLAPIIQRQALPNDEGNTSPSSETDTGDSSGQFIVADTASPATGQMQKTQFLDQLNSEVCAATDEALAGSPFSSDSCPYIRRAFARHRNSSPAQIEAVLNRYEPRTLQASSAAELISIIRTRTREAVAHWRNTGDLSGIPPEIAAQIPDSLRTMARISGALGNLGSGLMSGLASIGSSIASGVGNVASGIASGIGNVASGIASGVSSVASSIGGLFFKERSGGAHTHQSPENVRDSLGTGHSLDGQTRSRMESAFGSSFGDVQLHTDTQAASLSEGMNARAFTVGKHVAFGRGEYQPGSIVGDALIAHELAHVEQQRGGTQVQQKGGNNEGDHLEYEADHAALQYTLNTLGLHSSEGRQMRLKKSSGLSIQRCGSRSSGSQLSDYNNADPAHDPSRLSNSQIEATREYQEYMNPSSVYQRTMNLTAEEARLACQIRLRDMRTRATSRSRNARTYAERARRQLATAGEMGNLVGSTAGWVPSQPGSGNTFETWASAPSEGAAPPLNASTTINCWEMVLLAAFRAGAINWNYIHSLYSPTPNWGDFLVNRLSFSRRILYNRSDPDSPRPLRGDIVYFNGPAHIALATGRRVRGKIEIYSFWPPPNTPFHPNAPFTATIDQVKLTTIEDLDDHRVAGGRAHFTIEFATANWRYR